MAFSVDVALHINSLLFIDSDKRVDEEYLLENADEPVSKASP